MTDTINRVCMLKPMQAEDQNIRLEAGKNIIGRSRETGIRDVRCSKQHLMLNVNLATCSIDMEVLGINPSSVNGIMTMQRTKCKLQHGDLLELVYGRHSYEVVFKPEPASLATNVAAEKLEDATLQTADAWQTINNGEVLVFTAAGVHASSKIAAYDLDWTIIKTRSGNVFPKTIDDWELLYGQIPKKMQQLHADGFKICIFTNQGGIAKGKMTADEFKRKIRDILQKLSVPVQVFAATGGGYYRKPLPGMWLHMRDALNNNVPLQLDKCFYVGDAAGRAETGKGVSKRRKDHSLVDRLFAANVGITFYTPEMHFLSHYEEPWTRPTFEPTNVDKECALLDPENTVLPAKTCELIVLVGLPGSGKSHFSQHHLAPMGYKILNADTLGSVPNCLKSCEKALSNKEFCVVDNTNVTREARLKFVELAKKLNVPCRCFVMDITDAHAKHNISFRELTDDTHSKINDMVLNGMKKRYTPPTLDEGFDAVIKVRFKPKFTDSKNEQLYKLYLLEK